MRIKRNILLFLLGIMLIPTTSVFALENSDNGNYITNSNGIKITEKELKFIEEFYDDEYFETMTLEEYNWIKDLNINEQDVEIKKIEEYSNPLLRGSNYSTANKKLVIAKSCISSVCTIIVNATWLSNPTIRSYDVIGARFVDTTLMSEDILTKVHSSSGTEYFSNTKVLSNGVGTSVKLPSSATNISVEQRFYTKPGGKIYASYQHAIKNISLSTSLSYTIAGSGYGGVFLFNGSGVGSFDQMHGVDIAL